MDLDVDPRRLCSGAELGPSKPISMKNLVFINEAGVNLAMIRIYAHVRMWVPN